MNILALVGSIIFVLSCKSKTEILRTDSELKGLEIQSRQKIEYDTLYNGKLIIDISNVLKNSNEIKKIEGIKKKIEIKKNIYDPKLLDTISLFTNEYINMKLHKSVSNSLLVFSKMDNIPLNYVIKLKSLNIYNKGTLEKKFNRNSLKNDIIIFDEEAGTFLIVHYNKKNEMTMLHYSVTNYE